jgi:hypothetical protein
MDIHYQIFTHTLTLHLILIILLKSKVLFKQYLLRIIVAPFLKENIAHTTILIIFLDSWRMTSETVLVKLLIQLEKHFLILELVNQRRKQCTLRC